MSRCPRFPRALMGLTAVMLLLSGSGCGRDHEADLDAKIAQDWMRPGMYVDAIEYLESGGHYHAPADTPGAADLDRDAILPFLSDLKQEFGKDLYAILVEDDDLAWGFVMKLPTDAANLKRFEDYLESVRPEFPGMVAEQWGHVWISFDFLDEEEAEFIREAEAAAEADS